MGYDNVSHGCISLSPEDAEWYYDTVNVGDPVIVQDNSIEVPRQILQDTNPSSSADQRLAVRRNRALWVMLGWVTQDRGITTDHRLEL
jgi:hypothetical protein